MGLVLPGGPTVDKRNGGIGGVDGWGRGWGRGRGGYLRFLVKSGRADERLQSHTPHYGEMVRGV